MVFVGESTDVGQCFPKTWCHSKSLLTGWRNASIFTTNNFLQAYIDFQRAFQTSSGAKSWTVEHAMLRILDQPATTLKAKSRIIQPESIHITTIPWQELDQAVLNLAMSSLIPALNIRNQCVCPASHLTVATFSATPAFLSFGIIYHLPECSLEPYSE